LWTVSAAEEHWQSGLAQDVPGGAAEHQLAQPCVSVGAHDQQIRSLRRGLRQQDLAGIPVQFVHLVRLNGNIARGKDKEKLARTLGARRYLDSQADDVAAELGARGGARVILATVTSAKAMTAVVDGLAVDGKLLVIGAAAEPIEVSPFQLIGRRASIQGWPSGVAADSEETLSFSALSEVRPMVETFPLEQAAAAYERMMSGAARFRVVLTMGD
jgi:D-arabinose 1-dehydrogenase-like Zn-dependent alcohol dehydrogenase